MRNCYFLLIFFMFYCGSAHAERGDPMMAWPQLVEIDWDTYHEKMIENCRVKFPENAISFQNAISKWNDHNAAAILDIRRQIKDRIKSTKGLSESEVTNQMDLLSNKLTETFLNLVANTPENEWKDVCTGKYASETLSAMDFEKYLPIISKAIPAFRDDYLLPVK